MKKIRIRQLLGISLCWLILGGGWLSAQAQTTSPPDKLALFYQAGLFYKDGDYSKAIETYEAIIAAKEVSGPVYYNLANSYFKNGQLGRALLNYERARQFMPRDSDLKANHAFALAQIKSAVKPLSGHFFKRFLAKYAENFSADELARVLLGLYALLIGSFVVGLYLRLKRSQAFGLLGVIGFLFVFQALALAAKFSDTRQRAIVLQETAAKFEPTEKATTHFALTEGENVRILKNEDGWIKLQRLDGKIGWVGAENVEEI